MAYLIYALDYANQSDVREKLRDAHRHHLKHIGNKLMASGALLGEDGSTVIGGVSLLDTDDLKEAEKFADDDPYTKAGIRKEVKILKWRKRWWDGVFLGE